MSSTRMIVVAIGVFAAMAGRAAAQPVGTFSWQQQPYCNVLTFVVEQHGTVFTLDGFDDQCGSDIRASATGMAFQNPDGTFGLGIVIVATPGAAPTHLDATVTLPSGSGTWRDSQEASGTFRLLGLRTGGLPRPAGTSTISATTFSGVPTLRLRKRGGTEAAPLPVSDGLSLGSVSFMGWDGAAFGLGAYVLGSAAEDWTATAHGGTLGFYTVPLGSVIPLRRVTISPEGRVGIGTPVPSEALHVSGDARVSACVRNFGGGAIAGVCPSDARLKRQIEPLAPALDRVARLRPVSFSWRASEFPARGFGEQREIGVVAQEVEPVFPSLVSTGADGFKAVNYSALTMVAIQAIKELKEKNDALSHELAALKTTLAELTETARRR